MSIATYSLGIFSFAMTVLIGKSLKDVGAVTVSWNEEEKVDVGDGFIALAVGKPA